VDGGSHGASAQPVQSKTPTRVSGRLRVFWWPGAESNHRHADFQPITQCEIIRSQGEDSQGFFCTFAQLWGSVPNLFPNRCGRTDLIAIGLLQVDQRH
jgi:hypothetical protein